MSWSFLGDPTTHRISVGGRVLLCTVSISVAEEEELVEGSVSFGDADAEAEYYARFESGELLNLCVRVLAAWQDSDGSDFLGGCHVVAADWERDVEALVKDHAMVDSALNELKLRITERSKVYAGLAE